MTRTRAKLTAAATCTTLVVGALSALEACSSSSGPHASGSMDGGAGSDSGSSMAIAGDAAATCAAYAAANCQFISACEPGTLTATYAGALSQCESAAQTNCLNNIDAPGSMTTAYTSACMAQLAGYAGVCADAGPVPHPIATGVCATSGTGDAGAACGVDSQCATGSCIRTGSVCGSCSAPGAPGTPCGPGTAVTCSLGLACGSQNTCVTVVDAGASCDRGATTTCENGADCVVASADSGTAGTCMPRGVTPGAPCDTASVGSPTCWDVAGFFCNGSKQCQAIGYVMSGTCGEADGGTMETECSGGMCVGTSCASPAAVGGGCDVGFGAGCAAGSVCAVVGSAAGCSAVNAGCFGGEAGPPPFTFAPSNVSLTTILDQQGMAADENISMACQVNTDANSPMTDCFTSPIEAVTQADGSTVNLIVVSSLALQSTGSIIVSGGVPLVIVSLTSITVLGGNIQANSSSATLGQIGPGGGAGATTNMKGGGEGGGIAGNASTDEGGSGGSFCGLGGLGGAGTATGVAYGTEGIRPLVGGSGGGGGEEGSGAGGGAVQLVAAQSIDLGAGSYITVGGEAGPWGAGVSGENAGGAGSGGAILLEAPLVTVVGTLAANGGGGGGDDGSTATSQDGLASATAAKGGGAGTGVGAGGDGSAGATIAGGAGTLPAGTSNGGGGGGGAGRIRLNTSTAAATTTGATISPAATTKCVTQGFLRALGDGP